MSVSGGGLLRRRWILIVVAIASFGVYRAAWARRRNDPDMRERVDGLLKHSPEFGELWRHHEVAVRRRQRKTFLTQGPIGFRSVDETHVLETIAGLISICRAVRR